MPSDGFCAAKAFAYKDNAPGASVQILNSPPKPRIFVGLYLASPINAFMIGVDEKLSIQALERATGYGETKSGKIVRGCKSTYKRHGTLTC